MEFKLVLALQLLVILLTFNYPTIISGKIIIVDDAPQVTIANGELRGKFMAARNDRIYSAFEGIPYAQAERYQAPVRPNNWTDVRDATTHGSVCPQFEQMSQKFIGDENCLFANVYVPMNEDGTAVVKENLPIFFWIHGGGFRYGAGSFEGGHYMIEKDVILITINYRLANFGFLSLDAEGDGLITENNGLRDMITALQWTQGNINSFHGNPSDLTLAGESAGSASVHSLLLSPEAKGLFQRAIAQSGTVLGPRSVQTNPKAAVKLLASTVNCSIDPWNPKQVIDCLRSKSILTLLEADLNISLTGQLSFIPTIDRPRATSIVSSILPDTPTNLIALYNQNSASIPFLIGHNQDEGIGIALGMLNNAAVVTALNNNWNEMMSQFWNLEQITGSKDKALEVAAEMKKLYLGDSIVSMESLKQFTKLQSDFSFIWSIRQAAVLHASVNSFVYPYVFAYQGNFSITNLQGFPTQGVGHADELQYLFDSTMDVQNWYNLTDEQDENFSIKFIETWTSFTQTGVPKSWGDEWLPLEKNVSTETALNFLYFKETPVMQKETEEMLSRIRFWDKVFLPSDNQSTPPSGAAGKKSNWVLQCLFIPVLILMVTSQYQILI